MLAAALSGCAHVTNYPGPSGPRYEGRHAVPDPDPVLRVVTFNVKWGREIDRVVRLLDGTPALRDADLLCLQEMSDDGVSRIARALGYDYVYYPAVRHPRNRQDFGNAILTRWPILDDRKIVLPERHRFRDMQRVAVAATITVAGVPVRAYCLHLETAMAIEGPQRRRQAQAVLQDAARHARVIVAGDFNNRNQVGALFEKAGYDWLTEDVRGTFMLWTWDHIFVRGLALRAPGRVGVVRDTRGASDHRPVWAELALPQSDGRAPAKAERPASAVRNP